MEDQQWKACSFQNWYKNFSNVTFKSEIIPLPSQFLAYLNDDGVVLPAEDSPNEEVDEDTWDSTLSSDHISQPSFPEFQKKVEEAISRLGGLVFPKLNWSSPRDASWISHDGTTSCRMFGEICLLLKSSDFIAHDLNVGGRLFSSDDAGFTLVLRRWSDLSPSMEFRCFVSKRRLVAISQRHHFNFYSHLLGQKQELQRTIYDFFVAKIANYFPLSSYIFDVHVYSSSKIRLIDFNPYHSTTDPLLFTWLEIEALARLDADKQIDGTSNSSDHASAGLQGEFRVVETDEFLQPAQFLSCRLPKDFIDLSTGVDINKMVDFLNINDLITKSDESN